MTPSPRHLAPALAGLLALCASACDKPAEPKAAATTEAASAAPADTVVEAVPTPVTALNTPPATRVGPAPSTAPPPSPAEPMAAATGDTDVPPGPDTGAGSDTDTNAPRFFSGRTWTVVRSEQLSPGMTYRFERGGRLVITNPGSPPLQARWEAVKTGKGAGPGAQAIRLVEPEGSYPATLIPRGTERDAMTMTVRGPGEPIVAALRAEKAR